MRAIDLIINSGIQVQKFSSTQPHLLKQVCHYTKGFVGPPDPTSNLRKYKYELSSNPTPLEKRLFEERERVQQWNDAFWRSHNTRFLKERDEFIKKTLIDNPSQSTLNAEEMSVFYKKFLDENWKRHVWYNFTWYKKNINVTFLHFKAKLSNLLLRKN